MPTAKRRNAKGSRPGSRGDAASPTAAIRAITEGSDAISGGNFIKRVKAVRVDQDEETVMLKMADLRPEMGSAHPTEHHRYCSIQQPAESR
ncbi:hypothetical protein OG497_25185 [Streptomyces sp. NBC_01242]|uniref:hypothetical protein n=1 Tax=Streptomyces sp. NBC_01242 TaxID=2903795 RepID=UPI002255E396|nr:hypothetical protein [Streptomyces sp. NBC_01242]MCX4797286.1 hypothetical protein [Streptomyces sp. NBC_01242]